MNQKQIESITIPRWFDRHLHIRDGDMMRKVLPSTLNQRATGAVIMPNLIDPISTVEKAMDYRQRIQFAINAVFTGQTANSDFLPCMTLYLTDQISPEEVVRGFDQGAWSGVKLYMADQQGQGGTTGSHSGVKNLLGRYRVFEAMEKHGIPLLGHFEAVERVVDEFDREVVSLERDLMPILKSFPNLEVVFEHITDGRAADFVAEADHKINATVTVQHMTLNRNEMFWGGMNPVNYCKPVPKREEHRQKVRRYVTSGHPRFGAGTDSAPHDVSAKSRCSGCAAGIFTADSAVERYTAIFEEDDALQHLGPFLSENFLHIYGRKVSDEMMTIEHKTSVIPEYIGGVKVFQAGSTLQWKLV